MPERLLAKSPPRSERPPDSIYLPTHLKDVLAAANQMLDTTAAIQLAAIGLSRDAWEGELRRVVRLAAALHDLGKCNDQFQKMLRKPSAGQTLRHEWATLLILQRSGWHDWLRPALGDNDEIAWRMVRWCIAGHHPAYGRSAPPEPSDGPAEMDLPLDHPDLNAVTGWLAETFGLGEPPTLEPFKVDFVELDDPHIEQLYDTFYKDEEAFENADEWTEDHRKLLAAAKDTLVAADVAGSALPREVSDESQRERWVGDVLSPDALPDAKAYEAIVQMRLKKMNADRPREFQSATAETVGRVTLLRAGCGTGKTLAAYHWASHHCDGRRLFVCYPTTGTATEGFRDYLLDPPLVTDTEKLRTDLMHGRRKVDFKHLLGTSDEDRADSLARIESLDLWRTPVVACTVDTVLGLVQNNRRGLMSWPAIAQAGFVFDEIHAYDTRLFDALLHFLQAMRGVPVLLMTASLPEQRLKAIKEILVLGNESLAEIEGPEQLEKLPRYHREDAEGTKAAHRIREALQAGGKVLRVCNTVRGVMAVCDALASDVARGSLADLDPLLYHSRFRYCDRVHRHQDVINAFDPKKTPGKALAVCSQVAEMSLDISATLLVTDLAPVPALIQRLGRLNRRAAKEGDPVMPFIVVDPLGPDGKFSALPYREDELEQARTWLAQLGDGKLSQADLAQAWEQMQAEQHGGLPARGHSAWLDFGPETPVLELREGTPGVTVVWEPDLPALDSGDKTLPEVAIPMPVPPPKVGDKRFEWQVDGYRGTYHGVPVAKKHAINYDERRGARWQVS